MSVSLTLNEILFEMKMQNPSVVDFGGLLLNWEKVEERIIDQVPLLKFIITMGDQNILLSLFLTKII